MGNYSRKIADLWQEIIANGGQTLAPERDVPRSPEQVIAQCQIDTDSDVEFIREQTYELLVNMRAHFPDNIFWDVDALIYSTIMNCSPDNIKNEYSERVELMIELMSIFGRDNAIRFQYFHDFTLGFDFIKWLGKTMPVRITRADPFGLEFLKYMRKRGYDMLAMIGKNEGKYRQIPAGEYRNSYPFSRSPKAEKIGGVRLRTAGLIPLMVWQFDAQIIGEPDWIERRNELLA